MGIFNRIKSNKGFSLVLLVSTVLWVISVGIFLSSTNTANTEIIDIESRRALDHYKIVLNTVFNNISKIEVFTETVGVDNLTDDVFNEFVENTEFQDVEFISLSIAPHGVIEYYYSDEFTTSLIGLDLLSDDREEVKELVQKAIDDDVIVINGPFILIQGGNGIVFRKATYENGEFVSIINFVVSYDNLDLLLNDNGSNMVDSGIYDKDNNLIFGDLEYSSNLDVYKSFDIKNVDWHVGVNVDREYQLGLIFNNFIIVIIAFLLYVFAVYFGTTYYRKNKNLLKTQENLIHYDNLTNLPNRRLLIRDINSLIYLNEPFYLGFGDLDNFKNLNDILGHTVGDNYLRDISKRFHNITSDSLKIYRWGGDEFIFLFKLKTKKETISYLDDVYNTFKKPITIKETNYNVSMSIGVVNYPVHGKTIDGLIKRADIVMYDIKSQQKNTYGFFEDKYLENLRREVNFENNLYEYSIEDLEVYLQPIVSIKTNEIVGFEALSRMFDKEGNLINTAEMIKVYERKGDIFKLDKYIVEKACQYSVILSKEFGKEYFISFNISPITLSEDYICFLKEMIVKYKIKPLNFVIEIIETTGFKDIDESVLLLNKLRKLGFRIAMDDFGMGYSSLSYITRLPLSLIKIDRDFIHNYQTNEFDKLLIFTIRDISNSLKIEIIVEGIETEEQLRFLKEIGAHYYQGYFHSKPMSFNNIKKLLK